MKDKFREFYYVNTEHFIQNISPRYLDQLKDLTMELEKFKEKLSNKSE